MTSLPRVIRRVLRIRGVVQGVGYRPFVYQLAVARSLSGLVGNDSDGVFAEVEGPADNVEAFCRAIERESPPLARVDSVEWREVPPQFAAAPDGRAFHIVESRHRDDAVTLVSPDLSVCDDCLRELFDPADRRFGYPFINCTNCGPRFTITSALPYDRPNTTMAGFELCPACRAEYGDPRDRRFHAQPIACPRCGPSVWLESPNGAVQSRDAAAIAGARDALLSGRIVAVKGLGGFHLACDATRGDAVRGLRARKSRVGKPFAVMCADLEAARHLAEIGDAEAALLSSRERPIVLLRTRPFAPPHAGGASRLSDDVAPGTRLIGLMLPYTPLHHLLVRGMPPLVMTSGNLSDEPIVKDNDDARRRLGALADCFLMHDRDIHMWCDDSVVRVIDGAELPMRRSRGYAPLPVRLVSPAPRILAVGGELKATFCVTRGPHAFVSQHIGDMENVATLDAFERAVAHYVGLFGAEPEAVACDLHPGYLSRRWARDYAARLGVPVFDVQHHHAHIAAVLAEHRRDSAERVIGVSFDGTGYGLDGSIWGGEILVADQAAFERVGHLRSMSLPGGDAAIRRPYRIALAWLWRAGIDWTDDLPCVAACPPAERAVLARQLERRLNCVETSSAGRLFDAVAALAGGRQRATYEAQAALEFEAEAEPLSGPAYAFGLAGAPEAFELDPGPVLRAIVDDIRIGTSLGQISARFHAAVADAIGSSARRVREARGLNTVALSGGVFQNVLLLRQATQRLTSEGFDVLAHRVVPPNDGGLALGQAAVAATRIAQSRGRV